MKEKSVLIIITIGIILFISISVFVIMYFTSTYNYEMPDGTICDYKSHSENVITFYKCDNGNKYVNPPYYKQEKAEGET